MAIGGAHYNLGGSAHVVQSQILDTDKKTTPPVQCLAGSSGARKGSGGEIAELVAVLLAQLAERPVAELADPLAGDSHHPADLLEGTGLPVVQTEVEPQHLGIARRERR